MKILALVAAFNEEKTIPRVIEDIRTSVPEADICVVNDGSTDNTRAILDAHPGVKALHLPFNMGIGGAVWTGFNFAVEKGYDYVFRIDGDGQHFPDQAKNLLEPLQKGEADVVIGSRFLEKRGYQSSFPRRSGIKLLNIMTGFILRRNFTDNTSGFRAYNSAALRELIKDYPFDYPEPIEVYLLVRKGFRLQEIPATMRERQGGVSSISLLRTYYFLVKVMLTILVNFIGGRNESLSD
ncbi:MAG: glycosyltransferase family 2 protein [Acidobacteria bacterium]|nr:glycosyltransferase family 2 protein [Acidobacteriota bacterium]MBU1474565.1 glycosyltransferase family 2 protein [Acidobacteriota bacterium]